MDHFSVLVFVGRPKLYVITLLRFIQPNVYIVCLEKSQDYVQTSNNVVCLCVGIVHTAAAAELAVWGYEVYPAQRSRRTTTHTDSHTVPV